MSNTQQPSHKSPKPLRNYLFLPAFAVLSVILSQYGLSLSETWIPENKLKLHAIISTLSTVWLGYVLGISFLEAWKKFQAVSLTRKVAFSSFSHQIGLDVGRTIFHALNQVETILAAILFPFVAKAHSLGVFSFNEEIALGISVVLLAVQVYVTQPLLDDRALVIISGEIPPKSAFHVVSILVEFIKVVCLVSVSYSFIASL